VMEVAVYDRRPSRPIEPATRRGLDDTIWAIMEHCWKTLPGERPKMPEVLAQLPSSDRPIEEPRGSRPSHPLHGHPYTDDGLESTAANRASNVNCFLTKVRSKNPFLLHGY
jgi:hypothetical protein